MKTFSGLTECLKASGYKGLLLDGEESLDSAKPDPEQELEGDTVEVDTSNTGGNNASQAAAALTELLESEKLYIQSLRIVINYLVRRSMSLS